MMTLIITAAEICDCQKGIHETGVDGLCPMTMFVSFLGLFAAFGDGSREVVRVICLCAAGSCAGFLIWGAKPSKLFLGQSGGLFLGSMMCGILMLSGLHGAVLLAMAVPFIELAAHILQRAVFKRNKKLLFKGATLHEHLRNIGWSEYRITAVYAATQAVFCAGAAAYSIYESRLVIN
jgi:phospho-N-acetylmuramoyl-pentapeptide-transferase